MELCHFFVPGWRGWLRPVGLSVSPSPPISFSCLYLIVSSRAHMLLPSPPLPSLFLSSPPAPTEAWTSLAQAPPPTSLCSHVINKVEVINDFVSISLFPCLLIFLGWSRRCWVRGHIPLKCRYRLPNCAVKNLYFMNLSHWLRHLRVFPHTLISTG